MSYLCSEKCFDQFLGATRLTREFGQWQSADAASYAHDIIKQMDTSCELRSEQAIARAQGSLFYKGCNKPS